MALKTYTIDSILGGLSPLRHGAAKGQFLASQGIDPELQLNGRANGFIMPLTHAKFSSGALTGYPRWIEVAEKAGSTKIYTYCSDGKIISYDNAMTSETAEVTTITNGNGSGMILFGGYLVCAGTTNLSTVGALSAGVAVTNTWWTGLGLTALTAPSNFPSVRGVSYPYHAMHVHGDGFAYLCDWKNGTGMIHRIGVPPAGTGSLYNALDFTSIPIYPMALESYGTYLAIIGTVLLNNTAPQIKTGKSYLFLWDCVSDSFNDQIEIPSALVTAILNVNGDLWIWGAGANSGFQIYKYTGGSSVTLIYDSSTGASPPAGAVDSQNGRVFFGTYDDANTYDDAVIAAIGYQNPKLGNDAINFISNLGTNNVSSSMISALKCVDAATNRELPIAGYVTNTTTYGMAKPSLSAAKTSFFHSAPIVVGQKFKVRGLRITLTGPVASGVVVEPTIVFEDGADSKQFTAINNTNYSGQTTIHYKPMEIESFATAGANGINDFYLRLFFNGGTGTVGVALPIEIDIETLDD